MRNNANLPVRTVHENPELSRQEARKPVRTLPHLTQTIESDEEDFLFKLAHEMGPTLALSLFTTENLINADVREAVSQMAQNQ